MEHADKKHGKLYRTKTYLAGNLQNVTDEFTWRNEIYERLDELGIICLDPTKKCFIDFELETRADRIRLKRESEAGNHEFVQEYMRKVIAKDLRSIDISDFVIFLIEVDKPTYGTIHELVVAEKQHKPIILILRDKCEVPLWLSGLIEYDHLFQDIDECVLFLKKINDGEIQPNTKKWKLLEQAYR